MCGDFGRGVSLRIESTNTFIADFEPYLFLPPAPKLLLTEFWAEKKKRVYITFIICFIDDSYKLVCGNGGM